MISREREKNQLSDTTLGSRTESVLVSTEVTLVTVSELLLYKNGSESVLLGMIYCYNYDFNVLLYCTKTGKIDVCLVAPQCFGASLFCPNIFLYPW